MGNSEIKPSIELRNVVKRFPGITAVNNVSLQVEEGTIFSLLGPSGCGKTTAMRIIAGFEIMDEGDVLIDNKVVNDIPAYKRNCSMVFQTLALFPHMTVEENIAYGLERRKVARSEITKRVNEKIELMQLGGLGKRRPDQLSGGQRQRVALARSLVVNPKILLLDEPLSALDRKLRKEMQVELKQIQREVGITFFYVTHDQKEALSLSDKIAVMDRGELVQVGTAAEIYENPKTCFIADFMGAINIFEGKAVVSDSEKVMLETEDNLKIAAIKKMNIEDGDISGISVRPELINIFPANSGVKGDNIFKGKLMEMIYQGEFIETRVRLEQTGKTITAHVSSKNDQGLGFTYGEEILVQWDPAGSNILIG